MATVLDYSAGVPQAAAVRDAGYDGAVRYISPPRADWMRGKPIQRAEIDDFHVHGLDVAFVWQYGKEADSDVMRGRDGGLADARAARQKLDELGCGNHPVFFAVDFAITLEQWNVTAVEYFRACCEILGRERVGIYGHSRVISWAVEDGVIANLGGGKHLAWQTIAWSWGELSSEAVLFQRAGQVTVGGIECDVNDVWHHYWGQKPVSEVAPQPQSQPETSGPIVVRYDADFTADMPGVGYRSIDSIQSICVHTVECPPERDGIAVAQWQTNPANGSSYNVLAGADGILILCNTDDFMPYAAGPTGNARCLHISLTGYARMSREDWLNDDAKLRRTAEQIASWSQLYDIPLEFIDADRLRAGARGVHGHAEISEAWREVNHTDPGPGFPYDVVLGYAQELRNTRQPYNPTPTPTPETPEQGEERTMIRWILDQLVGPEWDTKGPRFTGWKATEGKTFVDFVADKIRLIPEIARTVATLPERLDRIEKMLAELQKRK